MAEKTPNQRAGELLEHLNKGKAINELFGDAFERQYIIYGKSPREWRRYFKVNIPETADTEQCKHVALKLIDLNQEVSFLFAAAEAQLDALTSGESEEYTARFNQLIAEYKEKDIKLPASKTLETMAQANTSDIRAAISSARIIKNFFKRILDGLGEVRKSLEIATWNNSIQSKNEQYGGGGNVHHTPERERVNSPSRNDDPFM